MWENEQQKDESIKPQDTMRLKLPKCEDNDGLIIVQAAICVAVIIFVLLSRTFSSSFFQELKEQYNLIINSGIDLSEQGELVRFVNGFLQGVQENTKEFIDKLETPPSAMGGGEGGTNISLSASTAKYRISVTPLTPVKGNISSEFGSRINPITNKQEFHAGTDLAAVKGSRVFASFSGTVEKSGYDKIRGKYILIKHTDNIKTLYQHLDKIYVKENGEVLRGQIIGLVGKSGQATGYHLHYEIVLDNYSVNPEIALKLK